MASLERDPSLGAVLRPAHSPSPLPPTTAPPTTTTSTTSTSAATTTTTTGNARPRGTTITDSPSTPDPAPPVHPPDVVSYFDPASVGGGGPLRRLSTRQKERADAEARDRAARIAAGIPESRWRSPSFSRPQPTLVPLRDEPTKRTPAPAPALSPTWSSKTLADDADASGDGTITPGEKQSALAYPAHLSKNHSEQDQDRDRDQGGGAGRDSSPAEEHQYPDGGYGWVVLACCITLAGLTMGWGMTWGVFQAYYSTHVYPDASSSYLSAAGTTTPLFGSVCCFFAGRMGDRYGFKRVLYLSAFIAWVGLFSAAFATEVWHVLLTQGVLAGIGQGLAMPLFMSLPSQWFYKRRGFASGAAIGGAGLGGGFATMIVRVMLTDLGHKKTLIILSCVNLVLTVLATLLIRTRPSSPEAQGGGGPWVDKVVMSTARFWAITLSLLIAVLGYAMPYTWLPQYVALTFPHLDSNLSALPSTLLGFSVCIGRALAGASADRIGPLNTYLLVYLLTGIVTLALWLTAKTFAHICVFAVFFGICGPGFLGMVPSVTVTIFGANNLATNVGILLLATAPGNLASGPLGGALYDMTERTSFTWVIVTGACASFVGCAFAIYARLATERRIFAHV